MPGLRGDQLALYTKDMYKAEREGYQEIPTRHQEIFKVVTGVKGAGDKHTQILGAGDLTRHTVEGQDINFKSPVQGWEFLVKYWTYSDGIALTKEAVEDTVKLGNLLKDLANTWGTSRRVSEEEMGATVFNRGGDLLGEWVFNGTHTNNTDSSGDLLYDSEPLFNVSGNTRSTKGGGTYYNSFSTGALTPSNFETLYNRMTTAINRDERDRRIMNPMDTLLVESGAERFKAERIVDTSKGYPNSQLNDLNPYYKIVSVIDWAYLDDSQAFYVGKRQHKDFQFHKRQAPEVRFFRDEKNLGYKASINLRMGILIKNFRCWGKSGGTYA
jgi:hypothetical protein